MRLRHLPSGLIVIAEESRSQHENKAKALRRLRQALFLQLRNGISLGVGTPDALMDHPDFGPARSADGRLHVGRKDARYWPAVGVVLDVLEAVQGRVGAAASALGTTTGNLIGFLEQEPKVWQQVNQMRARFGQKPLK